MKKTTILLIALVCACGTTFAQPRAIGVRVGQNAELSFQQGLNEGDNILQVDVGAYAYRGVQATVTYNWLSRINGSSAAGIWTSYGGFGVGGGYIPCNKGRNFNNKLFFGNLMASGDDNWQYMQKGKSTAWFLNDEKLQQRIADGRKYDLYDYGFIGIVGMVGFEYEFSGIPLAISFEYRPLFGVDLGKQWRWQPEDYENEETGIQIADGRPDMPKKAGNFGIRPHWPGLWDVSLGVRYIF